ncbi:MAG: hypothetical protein Q8O95_05995 [bacterium]|nr:hypothetical protein [bacterium]
MTRTWCKYGNCSLEKLEVELKELDELWAKLEKNWSNPEDIEDVYRIYPLLDTTSAIARKMLVKNSKKNPQYKVSVVIPKNEKTLDTSSYLHADEHAFFNGEEKEELLANIVSTFLHGSEYVYMDTRRINNDSDFKIYVFVRTDMLCQSCADANLKKPKIGKMNYRKTTAFIQYDDCTCGKYVEVRSYISSISKLLDEKIKTIEKKNG